MFEEGEETSNCIAAPLLLHRTALISYSNGAFGTLRRSSIVSSLRGEPSGACWLRTFWLLLEMGLDGQKWSSESLKSASEAVKGKPALIWVYGGSWTG